MSADLEPQARAGTPARAESSVTWQQASLVDLLDRLLGTGVVVSGDLTISLAGVDLVEVRLHALLSTVRAELGGAP